MGLLSKFLKKVANETAEDLSSKEAKKIGSFFSEKISEIVDQGKKADQELAAHQQSASSSVSEAVHEAVNEAAEEGEVTIPGNSWGPTMPLEECQFNFPGPYTAYFEKILGEEFSAFRLNKEMIPSGRGAVYTLLDGEKRALVLEVLNSSSVRNKLRKTCRMSGTPYVRLYHDHDGWWNTRAYVVERCRKAMAGE
ncbi:MAG: hypothetical protein J5493_07275 [Lachnospiraceae bacterium]|nr:hypothetical protein [Lachnospiraceae bacterium]